jgi:large subunit ribosomal protein L13
MENKIHTIDAKNKVLGRLAVEIALLLRGKGKRGFASHIDSGDSVVVKNIREMKFTGRKAKQKIYYRHSGYLGSLRETTLEKLFEKNPAEVLRKAVLGMLPKNRTRAKIINRLKIEK